MNELPKASGIGLKAQHYSQLIENPSATHWLEVHPENYMGDGGPPHRYLTRLREDYALSMHGVGMSLGSANGVSDKHLARLKKLVERYQPEQVSEHLAWSHWNSIFLNDLLPLPYTKESLAIICDNIDKVQTTLQRNIIIENPSSYIDFQNSDFDECTFFAEICQRTGSGILLDINNVFVSAHNNEFDAKEYIEKFPKHLVKEIHLAGHELQALPENKSIRIDDHGSKVKEEVWQLYKYFFQLEPRAIATLIEWDTNIPELSTLLEEANKADTAMNATLVRQKEIAE